MALQGLRRGITKLRESDPHLGVLIQEEKDVLGSMSHLSKERAEASSYLMKWGSQEHPDIMVLYVKQDITSHLGHLDLEFQKSLSFLVDKYDKYRDKLKEIKKMAEQVHELHSKHKQASEKLQKAIAAAKPVEQLQREDAKLEQELAMRVAEFESVKRSLLKEAIMHQQQGWEKVSRIMGVMATFQRHLAEQIPQGTLSPGQELPLYTGILDNKGANTTKRIYDDFLAACSQIGNVTLARNGSIGSSVDHNTLSRTAQRPEDAFPARVSPIPPPRSGQNDAHQQRAIASDSLQRQFGADAHHQNQGQNQRQVGADGQPAVPSYMYPSYPDSPEKRKLTVSQEHIEQRRASPVPPQLQHSVTQYDHRMYPSQSQQIQHSESFPAYDARGSMYSQQGQGSYPAGQSYQIAQSQYVQIPTQGPGPYPHTRPINALPQTPSNSSMYKQMNKQ